MAIHRFHGFNKGHSPACSVENNNLPNEQFCNFVVLKSGFRQQVSPLEICDAVQDMCIDDTIFAFNILAGQKVNIHIFFKSSSDVVMFKLIFSEIILHVHVKEHKLKSLPLIINVDKRKL